MCRVGQNRIYTPYMTVYLVTSLPKIPYIHRIYMVLANPNNVRKQSQTLKSPKPQTELPICSYACGAARAFRITRIFQNYIPYK